MSFTHALADQDSESFWEALIHYMTSLTQIWGDARVLIEKAWLNHVEYTGLRDWLFRCEELLRRLLFIDAMQMLKGLRASLFPRKGKCCAAQRASHVETPDDPSTWRVSFALAPASSAKQTRAAAPQEREPEAVFPAAPLARRFEALVRAFKARPRLARALARKIKQSGEKIAARLTQPTRTYQQKRTKPGDLAISDVTRHTAAAWADSS